MKKLLFVDHSFHAKTRATVFLQELLARTFEVEILWDERWAGGAALSAQQLNARQTDAIVFFQVLPRPRALRGLRCTNLTWVPMRDGLRYSSSRLNRLKASSLKTLNFCQEAHAFFSANGHQSLYAQYWPQPAPAIQRIGRNTPRIFFWPRRKEIGWETLKALLGDYRPEGVILRYASDPGHDLPPPSAADVREYKIELLQGWLEHAAYIAHLRECDVFMAPRPYEGIGQAMLEAMSHGLAVIAPDAPTMNEYVKHGRNGWLYNLSAPRPLDFSRWSEFGDAGQMDVQRGHAAWLAQADEVAAFIAQPVTTAARWDWRLMQALRL